ncbi:MAG: metal-dependent transcriptional regulator [Clostridia bacterium]|nr:metal-dependent transcriptional regulator [Clostridia bacterium]
MILQESGEMYIETIYVLNQRKGFVRAIDICEYMGFSKPSVSRAMSNLKEGGYIVVAKDGGITLTNEGINVAKKIYERHSTLSKLLTMLGVSPETAADDACKIEHIISEETFQKIKEFAEKSSNQQNLK